MSGKPPSKQPTGLFGGGMAKEVRDSTKSSEVEPPVNKKKKTHMKTRSQVPGDIFDVEEGPKPFKLLVKKKKRKVKKLKPVNKVTPIVDEVLMDEKPALAQPKQKEAIDVDDDMPKQALDPDPSDDGGDGGDPSSSSEGATGEEEQGDGEDSSDSQPESERSNFVPSVSFDSDSSSTSSVEEGQRQQPRASPQRVKDLLAQTELLEKTAQACHAIDEEADYQKSKIGLLKKLEKDKETAFNLIVLNLRDANAPLVVTREVENQYSIFTQLIQKTKKTHTKMEDGPAFIQDRVDELHRFAAKAMGHVKRTVYRKELKAIIEAKLTSAGSRIGLSVNGKAVVKKNLLQNFNDFSLFITGLVLPYANICGRDPFSCRKCSGMWLGNRSLLCNEAYQDLVINLRPLFVTTSNHERDVDRHWSLYSEALFKDAQLNGDEVAKAMANLVMPDLTLPGDRGHKRAPHPCLPPMREATPRIVLGVSDDRTVYAKMEDLIAAETQRDQARQDRLEAWRRLPEAQLGALNLRDFDPDDFYLVPKAGLKDMHLYGYQLKLFKRVLLHLKGQDMPTTFPVKKLDRVVFQAKQPPK